MCHLNASVLIKGIPGTALEFILLRKQSALENMAVKGVTSFPAAFDQLDHLHSCYKNVRTVSIQKVSLILCLILFIKIMYGNIVYYFRIDLNFI